VYEKKKTIWIKTTIIIRTPVNLTFTIYLVPGFDAEKCQCGKPTKIKNDYNPLGDIGIVTN